MEAAPNKHICEVDVSQILYTSKSDGGRVPRLKEEIFHADGVADHADVNGDDKWLELGPEDPAQKSRIHSSKLRDARDDGMSEKEIRSLDTFLTEFGDVVQLKLGPEEPVDVELLKIRLKPNSVPVRSK